jgi:hypothetical protein
VLGQAVHQREIVREISHAWIVDLVAQATDVQLRKMMIGWLLQGPTPSPISVMISRRLMLPEATTAPYHITTMVCCASQQNRMVDFRSGSILLKKDFADASAQH